MKKIKLMVVTPYFYPESGGVANYTYNLYKRLVKKNYDVVIITSWNGKNIKKQKVSGMKVYKLPFQFKISNTPVSFKWKKQIKEIIKEEKPDIINGNMPVPFICDVALSVSNNIPFVISYHHGGSMKKGIFIQDILISVYETIFLRRLLKKSNAIITPSEFVTNNFMKKYKDKTTTITPGVDIKKFKPNPKIRPNSKLMFVGNLIRSEEYKGLSYLLEAVKIVKEKVSDVVLVVIGGGDYQSHYKELSKKLRIQDNVKFKGKLNRKEIAEEYNNTNILMLPSLFDATPTVLIEAMACKKPVIATNVGGIPYVLENNKNSLIVEPKDSEALANAIITILKNKSLAKKIGEKGYFKVKKNFTWQISAEKTINLYKKLLK